MSNKKWQRLSKTIGTVFVDLGKLAFGSLMLGSILKDEIDPFQTFIFGTGIAVIALAVGIWFISMSEE
ncbi:hypothetical protein FACS1894110_06690 [Spirochaetia bacterium]|nr:hypothetical protein FACS1894110_06690 [Spirochaetia bacterium]